MSIRVAARAGTTARALAREKSSSQAITRRRNAIEQLHRGYRLYQAATIPRLHLETIPYHFIRSALLS
jgi:hypothetical protein